MATNDGTGTTFSIQGGAGSIGYTLAEISAAGTSLGRLAQLMQPLADRLEGEWLWLCQVSAGTAPYPHAALDAMRAALWSFRGAQAETAEVAAQATQAAANYASTESHNADLAARLVRMTALREGLAAWGLGPLAPWKVGLDAAGQVQDGRNRGMRDASENILNNGSSYTAGLLGPGMAMMYLLSQLGRNNDRHAGVAPAFALRKFLDATGLAVPGRLEVRQVPVSELRPGVSPAGQNPAAPTVGEPIDLEASIHGVLAGSGDAYGYPPGSISVVQIGRPDGSTAWVVHLPGTEDWSTVDSSNPFDMEGNMEALTAAAHQEFAQEQIVVQELIRAALNDAGALPGQEVLITGHSGGGIHAAAAAASPAFLADVNVTMVVMAGAPARNQPVQAGIAVLDLQNEDDIVTAADFGAPPAVANWVTVTSHRPGFAEGQSPGTVIAQAHTVTNYLQDAAALDSSSDPSIVAMRERLGVFLGVGIVAGATVQGVKSVYQGRDVNNPAPQRARPSKVATQPKKGADYSQGSR
ncbi:hypothetical protein [Arthrobacter sp. HLT1-20]